jgi:hypothetical protein
MERTLIDKITNVFAVIAGLGTALYAFFQALPTGEPASWFVVVLGLAVTIGNYFTGKPIK